MLCRYALPAVVIASFVASAQAALVLPVSEEFDSGANGWVDNSFNPLTAVGSGGWDGGPYVTTDYDFANAASGDFVTLFRGETGAGTANASGGAFAGDWITAGATELSFRVRHDSSEPVEYFARFTTQARFPGGFPIVMVGNPVAAGDGWTEVTIALDPSNFIFPEGGGSFASVFGALANIQFGVVANDTMIGAGAPVTFDLDYVSLVPAPASGLALLGALGVMRRRR